MAWGTSLQLCESTDSDVDRDTTAATSLSLSTASSDNYINVVEVASSLVDSMLRAKSGNRVLSGMCLTVGIGTGSSVTRSSVR
jgi:hypothetical protein